MQKTEAYLLHVHTHSLQDVRTEPKYMLPGGAVYEGAWCRPQARKTTKQHLPIYALQNLLLPTQKEMFSEGAWCWPLGD